MNRRMITWALRAALLVAIAAVVYSNLALRRELDRTAAKLRTLEARLIHPLRAGEPMPPLRLIDRSGRETTVRQPSPQRYVVVVAPNCGSCDGIIDEIQTRPKEVLIISALPREASGDLLKRVPGEVPLYFPSRTGPPSGLRGRIDGFPRVLQLAPDGTIRAVCRTIRGCEGGIA